MSRQLPKPSLIKNRHKLKLINENIARIRRTDLSTDKAVCVAQKRVKSVLNLPRRRINKRLFLRPERCWKTASVK